MPWVQRCRDLAGALHDTGWDRPEAIEEGATLDAVTGPIFFHTDLFRLTPRDVDDIEGLTAP